MDSTGDGAIHWRVFVTTVYDTTGTEGAGLFISVSLLLQCTTRQASRRRGYSLACLCYYSVRRDRQAGGGAIHWRVFVTTVYDATGKQGAGLFMGALTWKGNLGECLNTLEYRADSSVFSNDVDEPPAQYCSIILLTPRWLLDVFENLVRSFFLHSVQFQHC